MQSWTIIGIVTTGIIIGIVFEHNYFIIFMQTLFYIFQLHESKCVCMSTCYRLVNTCQHMSAHVKIEVGCMGCGGLITILRDLCTSFLLDNFKSMWKLILTLYWLQLNVLI